MSKFSEYNKARKDLDRAYALGNVSWIEFACRNGVLLQLINEERSPCADKASKIWDGSTASQQYLRRHSADIIEASSDQPFRVVTISELMGCGWLSASDGQTFINRAFVGAGGFKPWPWVDGREFTVKMAPASDGTMYAAGMGVGEKPRMTTQEAIDLIGDAISRTELVKDLEGLMVPLEKPQTVVNMTVNFDGANCATRVHEAVMNSLYPHREECADAAQWLWMGGRAINVYWYKSQDIKRIIALKMDKEGERQDSADKAQALHLTYGHTVKWLRANAERIDEHYARFTAPPEPRKRTRITIKRLGSADRGGMITFNFYLDGAVIASSMREGKISSGGPYVFYSDIVNFDSVSVTGDCDYAIERGVSE